MRKGSCSEDGASDMTERFCYDSLVETEKLLDKAIRAATKKTTAKKQLPKANHGPFSAGDVVRYGVKREWIIADCV